MKSYQSFLLIFFFMLFANMTKGQSLKGDWSGKLSSEGQEFLVIFHFSGDDKNLEAKMDVPAILGATGIKAEKAVFKDGEIQLSLMNGQSKYTAQVKGNTMQGTYMLKGMEMPLKMTKDESEKPINTPLPDSDK